jgi:hypothetical protein
MLALREFGQPRLVADIWIMRERCAPKWVLWARLSKASDCGAGEVFV